MAKDRNTAASGSSVRVIPNRMHNRYYH